MGFGRTSRVINLEGLLNRIILTKLIVSQQVYQRLLGEVGLTDQSLVLLGLSRAEARAA